MNAEQVKRDPAAFARYFRDEWLRARCRSENDAQLQRIMWRRTQLQYIRDVRELMDGRVHSSGPTAQAYRDRWAALCRSLCVNGRPVLADVSYGNDLPVGVFD